MANGSWNVKKVSFIQSEMVFCINEVHVQDIQVVLMGAQS